MFEKLFDLKKLYPCYTKMVLWFREPLMAVNSVFRILLISLLLNLILFGAFFLLTTPGYDTNDDIGMMLIVSGVGSGEPSEYLVFTNILIGKLLKQLYIHNPDFNWYTLYLYLLHFIAMVVVGYSLLLHKNNRFTLVKFLLLFFFFELTILMRLQFTSTAMVVGISALTLFLVGCGRQKGPGWVLTGISLFLLIVCGLVREKTLYLLLMLAMPLLGMAFWKKRYFHIPVLVVVSFLGVFLLTQYDRQLYERHEGWQTYREYNNVRGQLHGYPRLEYDEETQSLFERIGWSENDSRMFGYWLFMDPEVYSQEKLAYLVENIRYNRPLDEALTILLEMLSSVFVMAFFFLLVWKLIILHGPHASRSHVRILLLVFLGVAAYLAYAARLPFRLLAPMVFFITVVALLMLDELSDYSGDVAFHSKNKSSIFMICLVLLFLVPKQLWMIGTWSLRNQEKSAILSATLQRFPQGDDKLYVMWSVSSLPLQYLSPFSNLQEYRSLNLLFTGWLTNSPMNQTVLDRFGIKDIYASFLEQKGIYMIVSDVERYKDAFLQYLREHYGIIARFREIQSFDDIKEELKMFQIVPDKEWCSLPENLLQLTQPLCATLPALSREDLFFVAPENKELPVQLAQYIYKQYHLRVTVEAVENLDKFQPGLKVFRISRRNGL